MSTTSETPREEAWQAHLRSKHNHRQARRSSFDAGFEAGMRVILAAGPRAVAAAAWDEAAERIADASGAVWTLEYVPNPYSQNALVTDERTKK